MTLAAAALAGCGSEANPEAASTATATATTTSPRATESSSSTARTTPSTHTPTDPAEQALTAALRRNGFIPDVANEATAVILGQAVCHRYDVGDNYLAAVATMAEAGMEVIQAVRLEEAATETLCPEYADASAAD